MSGKERDPPPPPPPPRTHTHLAIGVLVNFVIPRVVIVLNESKVFLLFPLQRGWSSVNIGRKVTLEEQKKRRRLWLLCTRVKNKRPSSTAQGCWGPPNTGGRTPKEQPTQNIAAGQHTAPALPQPVSLTSSKSLASNKSRLMTPRPNAFLTHGIEILKPFSTQLTSTRNGENVWSHTQTMHTYTHIDFMCTELSCGQVGLYSPKPLRGPALCHT